MRFYYVDRQVFVNLSSRPENGTLPHNRLSLIEESLTIPFLVHLGRVINLISGEVSLCGQLMCETDHWAARMLRLSPINSLAFTRRWMSVRVPKDYSLIAWTYFLVGKGS